MSLNLRKYFGLVSITGLTGLVVASAGGCGEVVTIVQVASDAGPGGATKDAKAGKSSGDADPDPDPDPDPPTKDASAKDSGPSAKDSGPFVPPNPTSCLDPTPINATQFPYTKAGVTAAACTDAELTTLATYFKTKSDNAEDVAISLWSATVSASCAKCVFSDGTGTTWTPILTANDELKSVNRGGCIEVKSGKESCGRAYQQATECRLEACLTICQTQAEFTSCLADGAAIFSGPCKTAYDKMDLECGANLATYETACKGTSWTFEGPIKVQCITGN